MYLTIVHSRETKIRSLAFGSTEGKSLCMYSSSGSCVLRVGLKHPLHMAFHGTVCPKTTTSDVLVAGDVHDM
jgi:hypothetical protein